MSTSTATDAASATSSAANSASMIAEMQGMASSNNAMTMAGMQINMEQQETSALASVGNNGAKNVADAAKGQ